MSFIHEDRGFNDLLRIVAKRHGLAVGLVEKDYWVTHVLWAIHNQGFDVWFKGGTSLSKGFDLIKRFSEDLDLKIEPGSASTLPLVTDWTRESTRATRQRRSYFETLADLLQVAGAEILLSVPDNERRWTSANLHVRYPGRNIDSLSGLTPFVLLEVGSARVTPSLERDLTSFVHDHLGENGQLAHYHANRPSAVRCVHPFVTLIEKLDNLHRRVPRADGDPATFVRHFEDAAHIIASAGDLPALAGYRDVWSLADEMLAERQIRQRPASDDPAFAPGDGERWRQIRAAHEAIGPMFWGERIALEDACEAIRTWIADELDS